MIDRDGPIYDSYVQNTPLPRLGEPEDVANLARFLIGPESTWITGQIIEVDLAMDDPPAPRMARAPSAPSRPMPVSTTAAADEPNTAAQEMIRATGVRSKTRTL